MLGLTKIIFIGLVTDILSAFNHSKCLLLSNKKIWDSNCFY